MSNDVKTDETTLTEETAPLFVHDCDSCLYLGKAGIGHRPADLYFHPSPAPTLIARFGKDGDYISGLELIGREPLLALAAERALRLF